MGGTQSGDHHRNSQEQAHLVLTKGPCSNDDPDGKMDPFERLPRPLGVVVGFERNSKAMYPTPLDSVGSNVVRGAVGRGKRVCTWTELEASYVKR